jgi:TetR/AcrR family transcriptional repressor of nem operon
MPREKAFSESDVLTRAAETFTRHGYAGTSLSMLTACTGVAKQSLYNTYGGKRELFLKALESTSEEFVALRWLDRCDVSGKEAIDGFFRGVLGDVCTSRHAGCLLTHGLLELADDDDLSEPLRQRWNQLIDKLNSTVKRGQQDGSINRALTHAEISDLLMNLLGGLRVAGKARTSKPRMEAVVRHTLKLLEP